MSGEQTKPGVTYAEARAWLDGRADERIFAAYAVACAIAVREELDRRGEEIVHLKSKLEMRRSEAEDTLRGLTPGGSEFQTPAECAGFVRREREHVKELHRSLAAARAERDRAQEERDAAEKLLAKPADKVDADWAHEQIKAGMEAKQAAERDLAAANAKIEAVLAMHQCEPEWRNGEEDAGCKLRCQECGDHWPCKVSALLSSPSPGPEPETRGEA